MAKPKSTTLFHFTKSPDALCGILKKGFFPHFCIEDVGWCNPETPKLALPMVCFCDIPLSRIADHVAFYGSYGIGLTRDWGLRNGLNPVSYVSPSSTYAEHFRGIWTAMLKSKTKKSAGHFEEVFYLAAFHKQLVGEVVVNGKPIEKEFYQESEWRFVAEPHENKMLFDDEFCDSTKLKRANTEISKEIKLKISPSDIRYIFVRNDTDIPFLVNFINTELDHFSSSDLKILVTRILSLESVDHDL